MDKGGITQSEHIYIYIQRILFFRLIDACKRFPAFRSKANRNKTERERGREGREKREENRKLSRLCIFKRISRFDVLGRGFPARI